ncbi:hypothetical protein BB736_005425 [Mycobacterium avium subsp. hominissuis]|uniref:hypothetical protein n=1 Tax=Mycobacterium avium TaxID=1764 RepID=UPI003C2B2489
MSYEGPVLFGADHIVDDFDCGNDVLNEWLRTKALHNQREGGSRTWVVLDGRRVVAFYASSTAVLMRSRATKRAARNQPDPLPAVLLGGSVPGSGVSDGGVSVPDVRGPSRESLW